MIKIKYPEKKNITEIKKYFLNNNLEILLKEKISVKKKDMRFFKDVYEPDLIDLYRIHRFVILNKRISVLEYGTGWSSLVISHALNINEKKYRHAIKDLRFKEKFSLTILDNEKKYLKISEQRIKKFYKNRFSNTNYHYSENNMTTFNGRICSHFSNHPRINPDFIYMDGPDQFKIKKKVNGLSIADYEMMPMSSDILSYENFLTPGTMILFDGRAANARFLRSNFQRNWKFRHDEKNDQILFYLDEKPLGASNKRQLLFYKQR